MKGPPHAAHPRISGKDSIMGFQSIQRAIGRKTARDQKEAVDDVQGSIQFELSSFQYEKIGGTYPVDAPNGKRIGEVTMIIGIYIQPEEPVDVTSFLLFISDTYLRYCLGKQFW
jgi:hypothetical protein